jgi:alanine dehydrogenase
MALRRRGVRSTRPFWRRVERVRGRHAVWSSVSPAPPPHAHGRTTPLVVAVNALGGLEEVASVTCGRDRLATTRSRLCKPQIRTSRFLKFTVGGTLAVRQGRGMTIVGVPAEIKTDERRVALTPAGARELVRRGHRVVVEHNAGAGAGFPDAAYHSVGAQLADVDRVFGEAELLLKVKEPQPQEVPRLTSRHTLFTYLHLAADPELARGLMQSGARCIAYETVEDERGRLPLLAPMSDIAGRLAAQTGALALTGPAGGRGVLIGGTPGVAPAEVVVLGGGVAGTAAATVAAGMGARVTILDRSIPRLVELEERFGRSVRTLHASDLAVEELLPIADIIIGAVLVAGARAPRLVSRSDLSSMRPGSVLVDISIDQGGCFETSRPTTHSDPTYVVDRVVHYCVANMPGAVPFTSTAALTNATHDYVLRLADKGTEALETDPLFARGLNVADGAIVHEVVAAAVDRLATAA